MRVPEVTGLSILVYAKHGELVDEIIFMQGLQNTLFLDIRRKRTM
jgi:hypothetical protein